MGEENQDILSHPLIEQVKAENNFDFIRFSWPIP